MIDKQFADDAFSWWMRRRYGMTALQSGDKELVLFALRFTLRKHLDNLANSLMKPSPNYCALVKRLGQVILILEGRADEIKVLL